MKDFSDKSAFSERIGFTILNLFRKKEPYRIIQNFEDMFFHIR